MSSVLSPTLLSQFSQFIANEMGLSFPENKWVDLNRGVKAIAKKLKFEDEATCIKWLMSSPLQQHHVELLAADLTVGETYFFRDKQTFYRLEKEILPVLIQKRIKENNKQLRIWSAGCASGEEVYSIAIILKKVLPDIQNWRITLLATDINTQSLKKAIQGIYKAWSFRGVSDEIKSAYFKKQEEQYEILPSIKTMITPMYLNLWKDIYPSMINNTNAIDILFCRNVLMYFEPSCVEKIVKRFSDCLVNEGCLIVSPGESSHIQNKKLQVEITENIAIHWKRPTAKNLPLAIDTFSEEVDDKMLVEEQNVEPIAFHEPKSFLTPIHYAQDLANQGRLQEALKWCDTAIQENKVDTYSYYLRALILIELGDNETAETELKRTLYLDPNFVLSYVAIANLLRQKRNDSASLKYLNHALSCLHKLPLEETIPESGGLTAGRLSEIILQMTEMEK